MAKVKLNKESLKKIREAVRKAESKTSGEIATAVTKESYDYAIYELIFAVIAGFIYLLIIMMFYNPITAWLQSIFWDYSPLYLLMFFGFSTFIVITIFYFLGNLPFLDRIIVSRKIRNKKVKERAIRHFMESGVANTRDRTGILIFISLLEKRVELIADSGINRKIDQIQWQHIVDNIVIGINEKKFVENLVNSIIECGEILKKHFPIKKDDENELKNDIKILES